MKMIIDRKKMGKNLNFYFQIFMIIVFMGLFVFNRFESKRPEKEMRDSIPTITLYKEDGLLGDKLFFSYRNSNLYILTMGSKAYASEKKKLLNIIKNVLLNTDGNMMDVETTSIIPIILKLRMYIFLIKVYMN